MKITIYELLGLIKDGKAPKKIKYCGKIYEWDNTFLTYITPKDGLMVCLGAVGDEINMLVNAFNHNVEILDEEDEFIDIEELEGTLLEPREDSNLDTKILCCLANTIKDLIKNQKKIIKKLKKEGK